jgi:hypothetical protein
MNQLRQRVFHAFATGSAEELAAILQLLLILSSPNRKEPARLTSLPARQLCKQSQSNYLITERAHN